MRGRQRSDILWMLMMVACCALATYALTAPATPPVTEPDASLWFQSEPPRRRLATDLGPGEEPPTSGSRVWPSQRPHPGVYRFKDKRGMVWRKGGLGSRVRTEYSPQVPDLHAEPAPRLELTP